MQHPMIDRIERTGFPPYSARRESYGTDALGVEIQPGDELLVIDDELFVSEELFQQTIEALEALGATRRIAK